VNVKEEVLNIWDVQGKEWIAITTNGTITKKGLLVMGAGTAGDAEDKFPYLPKMLGGLVVKYGNIPFMLVREKIITFPVKHDWKTYGVPDLIVESARLIRDLVEGSRADGVNIDRIYIPRPGCGMGCLLWEKQVKPLLEPIFDNDKYIIVHTGKEGQ
jgi:hypothetical protein